jgi:hypothetical protein
LIATHEAPTPRTLDRQARRRSRKHISRDRLTRTAYQTPTPEGISQVAYSPLRATWQGPVVGVRPLRQVERPDLALTAEDVPPSVERGRAYLPAAAPTWLGHSHRAWYAAGVLGSMVVGVLGGAWLRGIV